jgi:hypothetical protein
MCTNEVASGEGAEEGELARHDGSGYDASKLLCVLTWFCRMSAFDTQHLQHGLLRRKDGATTNGANFYARHGDGDKNILTLVCSCAPVSEQPSADVTERHSQLHQGHTVR